MFKLSDNFWRRLNIIATFFVMLSIFGLLAYMANLEVKDLDLWLHLGVGKYIFEHGFRVPTVDILSCTIPGQPWVNHEWLFQVLVYWIQSHFGFDGLITMQIWLVSVTMLILAFLGYHRKNQLVSLFSLLMVAMVYQTRFTIRPDLFSLFFFAVFITVLATCIHKRWSIWVLLGVQMLWANMHGFFFMGPLLVLLGVLGEWFKRKALLPKSWKTVSRLSNEEYFRMKMILLVVVLACLITPQGFHGAIYPLKVFTQLFGGESKVFFDKIVELQKPMTFNTMGSLHEWPHYKILIIVSFFSFLLNLRRLDIGLFLFWGFFLVFSLSAVRNIVFFAFAAYLVIVINLYSIRFGTVIPIRFTEKKFLYITEIFAKILIVAWIVNYCSMAQNNGYFDFEKYRRKNEFGGISLRQYPHRAVDFLVKNKVRGNFYNDFNSGAYFVGRCFPDIKVFIDGRTEVYGAKFFNYYRSFSESDRVEEFKKALRRFQITGIFFNSNNTMIPVNMLKAIYQSKEWALVYFDYDGMIFLKDIPMHHRTIVKNRIDLTKWKAIEMDLYRLGAKEITQYQNINRAFTLEALDLDDAAAAEAKAALKVNPNYSVPYKLLGKIAAKKKDFETAYQNFRIAVTLAFSDQSARMSMALSLLDLKRYDDAAVQYQKIIDMWPSLSRAHLKLSKINALRKKYNAVIGPLQEGLKLEPQLAEDSLTIPEVLVEQKEYVLSIQCYAEIIKANPKAEKAYLKMCDALIKAGKRNLCNDWLNKGLAANPQSKGLIEKMRSLGLKSLTP